MGIKVVLKLQLHQEGKVFGEGPCELLRRIEASGSLHQAAAEMKMAYSKAWKMIRMIEKRLGFAVLEREIGGRSGGGSRVTPRAKELMSCYAGFREEVQRAVDRIFPKRFRSFKGPGPREPSHTS
jgi:molybdate transport system regulatory protein